MDTCETCNCVQPAPRHGPCMSSPGYPPSDPVQGCICDGERNHPLCHDFKERKGEATQ